MYHRNRLNRTEALGGMFEDEVPEEERYNFCMEYLGDEVKKEEVCMIVAGDMYKPVPWIQVARYLLVAVVGFILLIYYSDLSKPWN